MPVFFQTVICGLINASSQILVTILYKCAHMHTCTHKELYDYKSVQQKNMLYIRSIQNTL